MMISCKECGVSFDSDKGLHLHLRKHKLKVAKYYEKHYPMLCLQTGRKLPWKNGDDLKLYLSRRFIDRTSMYQYFEDTSNKDAKILLIEEYLSHFYERHQFAPTQMELNTLPIHPDLVTIGKYMNYSDLCAKNKWTAHFDYSIDYKKPLPMKHVEVKDLTLLIDTREQNPLRYYQSIRGKIDVGDYCLAGELYNSVCIERKSISDFWGTMAQAISSSEESTRFQRELKRARDSGTYLIILCEYQLDALEKFKGYGYANYQFIAHNMRNIFRQFSDCCQFVFTVNREISSKLLVEFLLCGDKIRKYDLQLWMDTQYPPFKAEEFSRVDFEEMFEDAGDINATA